MKRLKKLVRSPQVRTGAHIAVLGASGVAVAALSLADLPGAARKAVVVVRDQGWSWAGIAFLAIVGLFIGASEAIKHIAKKAWLALKKLKKPKQPKSHRQSTRKARAQQPRKV